MDAELAASWAILARRWRRQALSTFCTATCEIAWGLWINGKGPRVCVAFVLTCGVFTLWLTVHALWFWHKAICGVRRNSGRE